ncbi:indolepyruvate ferredoxin oxidoreductase [Steroidobacter agaridevorans]|uniref:Indolepyruvate ferredoxin oxidoreductase n=1 Tax=Steroidobacter agaridevorans TaxID=2695856 RepID=A0A829YQA9_9GAMM|nr:indolepyruvate ferredoxin oxidoreductase family protein [Steroidobacter agaridevorans]GFE84646.1 indolepyruvate ferredoxin oxidoreductase [Steroidobacter agaridevorans]
MLRQVTLQDKFECEQGSVYLNGPQAIVRILIDQKRRDQAAGLNTAGFISGYRGSPLGQVDSALWQARATLVAHDVHFEPGVNEELAATAVLGTQQIDFFGRARCDGVFSAWYGKGPGVDRAGDALKHGNLAGAARKGGVLVFAGDDHTGKSSTTCHQSEQALVAAFIPVLYPANVAEYLSFGRWGFELSRATGLWVGFKCINETADAAATVPLLDARLPFAAETTQGLNIVRGDSRWDQERRTVEQRLPAAQAFARANGIDRTICPPSRAGLGIITAGKAYLDVMEALKTLGLRADEASAAGIGVLKLGMTWPIEPSIVEEFCSGLREVLIVEDKRAFIEPQVKDILFHLPADRRPAVTGKFDPQGRKLLPAIHELTPRDVLDALVARLQASGMFRDEFRARLVNLRVGEPVVSRAITNLMRTPYFCSGCPHNSSTKTPQGSVALSGIGCHVMAAFMPHRQHLLPVQMGGEGANWVGAARFSETRHVFQNLGDGTFYHSGLLAIRQAVSAGVNVTYKLLYNDAVAMTGGQPVEGGLSVSQIIAELLAEGVKRVAVVADDVQRYDSSNALPNGMTARSRQEMMRVQDELANTRGVTVLIYDQVCAAEKRRRRKRGRMAEPPRRAFINARVCEGCGDCSAQSNCVSVMPLETEFGAKRVIDQSSCNKDFSCVEGFCPSFVTVHGGSVRVRSGTSAKDWNVPSLPEPRAYVSSGPCSILVTGIGGTGVITIGAVIAMAAHLEGKAASVLDMTGLSQKNGAVFSHIKVAAGSEEIHAARVGERSCDVLLACDMVAAGGAEAQATIAPGITRGVVNTAMTPTAAFTFMPDLAFPGESLNRDLKARLNDGSLHIDATRIAEKMLGDSIAANMVVVGAAVQAGMLPVSLQALEQAIRLNDVGVEMNLDALAIGRWLATDARAVLDLVRAERAPKSESLDELIARRSKLLTLYQDGRYAAKFTDLVGRVRSAEEACVPGGESLTRAVIASLFKLMAYKDEYEVARLYCDGEFAARLREQFEGDFRLSFHLAPPGLARRDRHSGKPRKITFGPWVMHAFKLLAALRKVRGTRFDVFGYSHERRMERALIDEYRTVVEELLQGLSADRHSLALQIAAYPQAVRGYGHVKAEASSKAVAAKDALLTSWRSAVSHTTSAPTALTAA